jgi:hypothetical protein
MKNVGHRPAFDVQFAAVAGLTWTKQPAGPFVYNASPGEGIPDGMIWPNINQGNLPKGLGLNPARIDSASVSRILCNLVFKNKAFERTQLGLTQQSLGEHLGLNLVFTGTTVFPDDEPTDNFRLYQTEESLRSRPPGSHSYIIGLTSCIEYHGADESTIHHEQSVYTIDRLDPQFPNETVSLNPDGKPVPASSLRLRLTARYTD